MNHSNENMRYTGFMFWILFSQLLACTPWRNHRKVAEIESPIEAKLIQSDFAFFSFTGNKLLLLPYIGCSAQIELVTKGDAIQVQYLKGDGGFIQRCPSLRGGEIRASEDGGYLAYRINSDAPEWSIVQLTTTGFFPLDTPEGFGAASTDWQQLTDIQEDPAVLLRKYEGDSRQSSTLTPKLLEIVEQQPSPARKDFLDQSVDTLKTPEWIALFNTLDDADQESLLDALVSEFLTETTDASTPNSSEERPYSARIIGIQERIIPLVTPTKHAAFLQRIIASKQVQGTEFQIVYAKYWTVDPTYTSEKACAYLQEASPDRKHEKKVAMILVGKRNAHCRDTIKDIQLELMPCCDDNCSWERTLPPREDYIQQLQQEYVDIPLSTATRYYAGTIENDSQRIDTLDLAHSRLTYTIDQGGEDCLGVYDAGVPCSAPEEEIKEYACLQAADPIDPPLAFDTVIDDEAQTIHVQSSGRITAPTAVIAHLSTFGVTSDDHDKDGYVCVLEGKPPFYGMMNGWHLEWKVNGRVTPVDSSLLRGVMNSLARNIHNKTDLVVSQYTYIPSSEYKNGDTLDCTMTVTKLSSPSLKEIIKTKSLGVSRVYRAESLRVP